MVSEAAFERRVKEYLRGRGAIVTKIVPPFCGMKGDPDLVVCWKGRYVAIELKVPGEEPTDIQLARIEKVKQAGGHAFWADNMESVISELGMLEGAEPC